MQLCNLALRANPNDAEAYYFRAYGEKSLRSTQDAAVKDIDRAISLNPNATAYYVLKALILHTLQEDEQALPVVEKAYKMAPTVWAVVDLKAQILTSLHKPADALKLEDIAVQHDAGIDTFHYTRAQILKQLDRWAEAEKEIDEAIKLNPTLIMYRQDRMTICKRLKKWDRIIADANYMAANSKYKREAYERRGAAHAGLKQYPEAIADFKLALKETHADAQVRVVHVQMQDAYERMGDTKGAEAEKAYLKKLDEDFTPL